MDLNKLNLPTEPVRIILTLTKEGVYESDVWVDGKFVGGGVVIGGFPAAYEQAQDVLWAYDYSEKE